jgi:hypothetical protein
MNKHFTTRLTVYRISPFLKQLKQKRRYRKMQYPLEFIGSGSRDEPTIFGLMSLRTPLYLAGLPGISFGDYVVARFHGRGIEFALLSSFSFPCFSTSYDPVR